MFLRVTGRPVRPLIGALAVAVLAAGCSSGSTEPDATSGPPSPVVTSTTPPSTTAPSTTAPAAKPTTSTPAPSRTATSTTSTPRPPSTSPRSSSKAARSSTAEPATRSVKRLPLDLSTGTATQVVTVVSSGGSDTTATVQRWTKSDGRWTKVGSGVDAYVGSGGIGRASEGSTRTPAGSFTLTQAFGRNSDPGTRLPYTKTTNADYWISNPGPLYNTRQRCSTCGYDKGINEHLREVTPEYDYAAVIDYNTRNAPGGVRAGRGSAFFLHVANGEPTAGCVAIPKSDLVRVLGWLNPDRNPRILIGTD